MMGLFINKESLDNNMNLLRETLKQKIEVINNLQNQLIEYSNLDSTSQAIEVLKTYARKDINNCFNQMVEVFNSIINKTYLIQDRYEQLCGNCSLDKNELEENSNKLNKVIRIVEEVKYNLDYIDLFDTLVSIDDQVSWYGDVFGFAGLGESSLNVKDYKSDIDSFYVLNYKKEQNIDSFEQARMNYYQELSKGTINEALTRINFSTISNIDELTQEHLDLIKTYQLSAYNFIINLMNGNNDYVEYV